MPRERAIGLKSIAMLEGIKGGLVLIAGLGLAALIHHDAQSLAEQLVQHLHLNPAKRYPQVFIEATVRLTDARLWALAAGAAAYAVVRFVEAYGLWNARAWAEWLAAVGGAIYLPFEIFELSRGVTSLRIITLTCNALIVAYMVRALLRRRAHAESGHDPRRRSKSRIA